MKSKNSELVRTTSCLLIRKRAMYVHTMTCYFIILMLQDITVTFQRLATLHFLVPSPLPPRCSCHVASHVLLARSKAAGVSRPDNAWVSTA